jgi:hypothetical protein
VDWKDGTDNTLRYCLAKAWLIDHMPEWDKHFLPPSVAVNERRCGILTPPFVFHS